MKELYIEAHEELITKYLEENPDATEQDAYNATAYAAYGRMIDKYTDMIDAAKDAAEDR